MRRARISAARRAAVALARDPIVENFRDTPAHVGGRLFGESDRGDPIGRERLALRDIAREQCDEALCQDLGLARARTGAHQHVTRRVDRVALFAREFDSCQLIQLRR